MASLFLTRTSRIVVPRLLRHYGLLSMPRRTMVMVTKTSATADVLAEQVVSSDATTQPTTTTTTTTVSNNSVDSNLLTITDSCMNRIQSLAEKRKESLDEVYLRVYVDAGGCSGFQYKFEMTQDADEAVDAEDDTVFTSPTSGARVVVDQASLELLRGSTIDFVQEMIKSAFAVTSNPQSESACGCGSSFAIKNFESNPALD